MSDEERSVLRAQRRKAKKFRDTIVNTFKSVTPNNLLLVAAGVDRHGLDKFEGNSEEKGRFHSQGALVFLTAIFAMFGAAYFFQVFFPVTWGWSWQSLLNVFPLAVLTSFWGAMIFFIDRMMLQSMLGRSHKSILIAVPRIVLAVMLGLIIAHPLKILIMEEELGALHIAKRNLFFEGKSAEAATRRKVKAQDPTMAGFPDTPTGNADRKRAEQLSAFLQRTGPEIGRIERFLALANTNEKERPVPPGGDVSLPAGAGTITISFSGDGTCSDTAKYALRRAQTLFALTSEYERFARSLNSQHFTLGTPPAQQKARYASILDNFATARPYINGEAVDEDNVPSTYRNCKLLPWMKTKWESARTEAQNQLDQLLPESARLERKANLNAQKVAQQREAFWDSCKLQILPLDISEEENLRREDPNENSSAACIKQYPSFSFVRQTALLFSYATLWPSGENPEFAGTQVASSLPNAFAMGLISLFLTLLFIGIETVPLAMKLMTSPGPYELEIGEKYALAAIKQRSNLLRQGNPDDLANEAEQEVNIEAREKAAVQSARALLALRETYFNQSGLLLENAASGEDVTDRQAKLKSHYEEMVRDIRSRQGIFEAKT